MVAASRRKQFASRLPLLAKSSILVCLVLGSFGLNSSSAEDELAPDEIALVKAAETARIKAIESVYGAVVAIYGNNRQGGGSGVLYDESGFALTNHHVVAAAGTEGWAGLADGRLYRWKLIGTDPGGDIAIIQLAGQPKFPTAAIGDSDTVRVGDFAMAMGNPFVLAEDQKPTVTLGIVSGVKRYQGGSGLNQLVYGNCIQIDSSINPGNSGGPLFNMNGEVIGINGRGSFKERGRVNVGLGYAISSNQIKNFVPDLLATKIAQHGTFDAVFGDRQEGVLCETINLDAPISELGLKLGDRAISLDGHPIASANQFTNIITTVPAGWPTELVYERDGKQATIWMRLVPLPYQTHRHVEEKPKEEPKKDGEEKPKTPPKQVARGPKISIDHPGEIRDKKLNQSNAKRITTRWREAMKSPNTSDSLTVFQIEESIAKQGQDIGRQKTLLVGDGRFHTEVTRDGLTFSFLFDGEKYWSVPDGDEAKEISRSRALLNPDVYPIVGLASAFRTEPLTQLGEVSLDGGDKSQNQISYRLKTIDDEGDWFYVWLSVFGQDGAQEVRLLKAGPDLDCDRAAGGMTYRDWRSVDGVMLPFQRDLVKGLSEQVELTYTTTRCDVVPMDAARFNAVKKEASDGE
jgi:serine protease Do